jgi:chromosome segregation ATPase
MPIDTLKTAKRLQQLGFDTEQAEGLTEILSESDAELATKNDLDQLEASLGVRIDEVETKLGSRIDGLGVRIDEVETKLGSRIDGLGGRIDEVETKLGSRIDSLADRIEGVDGRIDGLEQTMNERISGLEQTMNTRFEAMRADLEHLITLRMAWGAGLLALYITLISYVMG